MVENYNVLSWNCGTSDGETVEHLIVEQWNRHGGKLQRLIMELWNI